MAEQTPYPTEEILRALAYPARWRAYQALRSFGDMTGLALSRILRISEQSTNAHLAELARINFVTAMEDPSVRRRQWRWHAIPGGVRIGAYDPEAPWAEAAMDWLRIAVRTQARMLEDWAEVAPTWPSEWLRASELYDYHFHMTSDELEVMTGEIATLMARWRERSRDPSRPGVQPVWVATNAFPYPTEYDE